MSPVHSKPIVTAQQFIVYVKTTTDEILGFELDDKSEVALRKLLPTLQANMNKKLKEAEEFRVMNAIAQEPVRTWSGTRCLREGVAM